MKTSRLLLALLLFASAAFSSANAATLIAHWGFEEGSGTTAVNSSTNAGLDGVISDAAYTADAAVGGYALDFNGSTSFVEVANSPLLVPQTLGISLWFKARGSQVAHADIIDKGHGFGNTPYHGGYVFQYLGDTSEIGTIYGNGSQFVGHTSNGSSVSNETHHVVAGNSSVDAKDFQWHHVVANLGRDGASLFVDGQLLDNAPLRGFGAIAQNTSNLYFGQHQAGVRHFNGLIDEIRFYDGALSQAEVDALYNGATVVPLPAALPLFAVGAISLGVFSRYRRKRGFIPA